MARNRKRAKERRDRRPQPVAGRSRVAAAPADVGGGMPSPLEHATPDVELADAQLALGRAEADGALEPVPAAYADDDAAPEAEELSAGDGGGLSTGGGAVAVPGPGG